MKPFRIGPLALMLLAAASALWATSSHAGAKSAAEASEIARKQTGGSVLAVKTADGGFQVKVLTPDGQVRYVFVPRD